ncbi:MAG: DASS family sodium-coupled anion symporter [Planctomycetota bacterium]
MDLESAERHPTDLAVIYEPGVSDRTEFAVREIAAGMFRNAAPALACLVFSGLVVSMMFSFTDVPREGVWMSGIFTLAAALWCTQSIPLFATSISVFALMVIFLANPGDWPWLGFENSDNAPRYQDILAVAANPVIFLFFGGFLLAHAITRQGVDRVVAGKVLRPFTNKPRIALLAVMVVTAVMSMWMSNTAATALMIALTAPMIAKTEATDPFRVALILGVAFAANVGGMATPIGTPPNAVAVAALGKAGVHVSFLNWMAIGLPLMVALLTLTWLILATVFKPQAKQLEMEPKKTPLNARGWFVIVIFALTVVGWLTTSLHGLSSGVIALLPALALTATGVLTRHDIDTLEWDVLILIAGGIALGTGMQAAGLDGVIADQLSAIPGVLLVGSLAVITLLLSTFMSNTAAANLFLPIAIGLFAGSDNATPAITAAVCVALSASIAMAMPMSTPPNAIAFSTGHVTTRQMAVWGATIGGVGLAALVLGGGAVVRFWANAF